MRAMIQNRSHRKIDQERIRRWVGQISRRLGCMNNEISILFVDDSDMRDLNKRYRGIDRPTDVLSFTQMEGHESIRPLTPDTEPILGDIVISLETAEKQAKNSGYNLEKEVLILLIHGILHLMRYDHEKSKEMAQEMWQKEQELLSLIKIKG